MSNQPTQSSHLDFLPPSIATLIKKHKALLLYGAIGGGAVAIDMGLFWLANNATEMPILANTISIGTAMVYSFLMNAYFNFRTTNGLLKRFASFSVVTLFGYGVSTAMLWLLSTIIHLDPVVVKAASLPIVFIVQFMLNSKITFKQSDSDSIIEAKS